MRCYPNILNISYKDHVTNEEVRAKIQQASGLHEDLLTIIKRRKLHWYGHVSRSSARTKTILQATVKGGRRQGKRWKDNIGEWTGVEFAKSQRAVENRGKWRKLVAKSSVVPQRPSRLKDNEMMLMITMMICNSLCQVPSIIDDLTSVDSREHLEIWRCKNFTMDKGYRGIMLHWEISQRIQETMLQWLQFVCVCVHVCVHVRACVCVCVCVCVRERERFLCAL